MSKNTNNTNIYTIPVVGSIQVEKNQPKPELQTLQAKVGGLIEYVYGTTLSKQRGVDVIANEEGIILGLPLNIAATVLLKTKLFGPVVIVDNRSDKSKNLF